MAKVDGFLDEVEYIRASPPVYPKSVAWSKVQVLEIIGAELTEKDLRD